MLWCKSMPRGGADYGTMRLWDYGKWVMENEKTTPRQAYSHLNVTPVPKSHSLQVLFLVRLRKYDGNEQYSITGLSCLA